MRKPSVIIALLLLSLLGGSCTEPPAGGGPPRMLCVEPIDASSASGYQDVLSAWRQAGYRKMTVVHAGPKDGLAFIPAEKMKSITAFVRTAPSGTLDESLVNSDNYLFAASRLGLVSRVYWIIPFNHLAYINAEERIRLFLKDEASRFRQADIDSMKLKNGCVSGTLADVEVHICTPFTIPPLGEAVLVSIDTGFIPPYATHFDIHSLLGAMKGFFDAIIQRKIVTKHLTVISPPEQQAMYGFLSDEMTAVLKDPSILKQEKPPHLWTQRDQAVGLLMAEETMATVSLFDRTIGGGLDDPYLVLMRSTVRAFHPNDRPSALKALVGLCSERPALCGGIADAGVLLRERGDTAGAEDLFQKALTLQPGLDRVRFEYAVTLYRSGKYDKAKLEAAALVRKASYAVSGAFLLGDCAYARKLDEEALGWYGTALRSYREAGGYRLSRREQESLNRLKSLYVKNNDRQGMNVLERISAGE